MASTSIPTLQGTRFQFFVGTLALCFLLTRTYLLLMSQAGPIGSDGYYYVLQVRTLLQTGHLYYPIITPLVFYLQAAFAFVVGNITLGIKIATLSAVAVFFAILWKSAKVGEDTGWSSIFSATAICLASPFLFFEVEFLKNLFGLLFLFISYSECAKYVNTGKIRPALCALLSITLAALSHKSAAALGLIFLLYFVAFKIAEQSTRLANVGTYLFRKRRIVALGLTLLGVAAAFASLSNWHSPFRFMSTLGGKTLGLMLMPLTMIVTAAGVVLSEDVGKRPTVEPFRRGFATLISWLILPFCFLAYFNLGITLNDLTDRTCLSLFPFLAVLAPFLIRATPSESPRALRLGALLLAVPLFFPSVPGGARASGTFGLIKADVARFRTQVPQDAVIIAPHGVDFLLTTNYGVRAVHVLPKNRPRNLLHFVWKTNYIQRRLELCGYDHVDLGGAVLLDDKVVEKMASLELAAKGKERLTCPAS